MPDIIAQAASGDITAFAGLYENVYKKMYCAAYYTLVSEAEAIEAVKSAANNTFSEMSSCKNQKDFEALFLKKLSNQIIKCFRTYRNAPPVKDEKTNYIKAQMQKLTDSEKLAIAYNTLFNIDADEISEITGLARDVVKRKLESGQKKLFAKL